MPEEELGEEPPQKVDRPRPEPPLLPFLSPANRPLLSEETPVPNTPATATPAPPAPIPPPPTPPPATGEDEKAEVEHVPGFVAPSNQFSWLEKLSSMTSSNRVRNPCSVEPAIVYVVCVFGDSFVGLFFV